MVTLRTEQLGRWVQGKTLVAEVTFELHCGEVLALVGPSGSGKSSLLRLLNRLDEPTSGTVYVDGRDYRTFAPHLLRQRVGLVMQTPHLFPGDVMTNLRFGPSQRSETPTQADLESLLVQVGLEGYATREAHTLSGGEAQRVSLARTLVNSPDVLLLDEPTSALDEAHKRGLERLLHEVVRSRNMSCVLVTHDEAQAARLADHVLVLDAGRIVRLGVAREVLDADPAL